MPDWDPGTRDRFRPGGAVRRRSVMPDLPALPDRPAAKDWPTVWDRPSRPAPRRRLRRRSGLRERPALATRALRTRAGDRTRALRTRALRTRALRTRACAPAPCAPAPATPPPCASGARDRNRTARRPATTSVNPYTTNGARMEMPVTAPPIAGPVTPPKRKPAWNAPDARPRCSGPAVRSSSAIADTVNIADPIPPTPRSTRSWLKVWASAVSSEDPATTQMPIDMIRRSPKRSTMSPAGAALSRRIRAKPEMTVEAMNAETPNVRA